MKQKCYDYYCEKKQRAIGDGICCFVCEEFERPDNPFELKKCKHERVIGEFIREV